MSEEKGTSAKVEDSGNRDPPRDANDVSQQSGQNDRMNLQAYLAVAVSWALSSQFIAYINTLLMPSTILSYIEADLGPDPNYTWITVSWNVAASVMVTIGGRLSDIFGRRYFLIAASIVALCGGVVGATGKNINQMIASGVLFGIGGGLQETCYALLQEVVPIKDRIFAIGCFEFCGVIALLSPMIAYAMIAHTAIKWRSVYWYMFAFETFSLALIVLFYHPPKFDTKHRLDGKTRLQIFKQLDFVGITLFALGCIMFLIGVNWGGRQYAWSSAPVISTLVIGATLLVSLGFYEVCADLVYPILPPKFFRNIRGFTVLLIVCFVGGMLYYSMNVLWPRQSGLLFVPADDPIIAGVYANMVSFGTIIAGVITIVFCHQVGHERWQQVGFMVIQTALIASLASVGLNDRVQAIVTIIIAASTITPPQLLAFAMISMGIENQVDIGVANGLASTFRLMGGAVATAIYTAILTNRFAASLPSKMAPVIASNHLSSSTASALIEAAGENTAKAYAAVPGITQKIILEAEVAVKLAYVEAFRLVYLVAIAFGCLAIIAAAFTMTIPKERKTRERVVRLENEAMGPKAVEAEKV